MWTYFSKNVEVEFNWKKNRVRKRNRKKNKGKRDIEKKEERKKEFRLDDWIGSEPNP